MNYPGKTIFAAKVSIWENGKTSVVTESDAYKIFWIYDSLEVARGLNKALLKQS